MIWGLRYYLISQDKWITKLDKTYEENAERITNLHKLSNIWDTISFFGFLYLTLGNPVAQLANLHKPICKIVCIILVSQFYQASADEQGSILGLKLWVIFTVPMWTWAQFYWFKPTPFAPALHALSPETMDKSNYPAKVLPFLFSFFFSMATRRLVTVLVHKHMRAKLTPTNLMHLNFFFFLIRSNAHFFSF